MLSRLCSHPWFQHFKRLRFWQARCTHFIRTAINMFRISIIDTQAQRKLVVEGKLSDPWLNELRTTWRNASHELEGRKLVIDLNSLTSISHQGEDAILDLMREGAKFSCAGILTRHVLKRLARRCQCKPESQEKEAENIKK